MRNGGVLMAIRGATSVASMASSIPSSLLRRFGNKSSSSCVVSSSASASISLDHISFIRDVAVAKPPDNLSSMMNILQMQGESIISPGARKGLIPLVIPLTESPSGALTALLRWPTALPGMEMPVVEVHKNGVWLLAKNVDQYIQRILVEEDARGFLKNNEKLLDSFSDSYRDLYKFGDFIESHITDVDTYLLSKVGLFPDLIERKAAKYMKKGDDVSALVAGEFYTKNHFPGFGRPFVFNAEILLKVGRKPEAKDAARGALKSPWWTLGCNYKDVANIAEWDDEQIEYIKEKLTKEGKQEDLKKGKAPAQVALDEAAFLLDLASIEGTWNDVNERISQCYIEAGVDDIAKFILYRD